MNSTLSANRHMDAVGREPPVLLDKLRGDLCPEAWQPTRSPSLVAKLVLGGGLDNLTNKLVPRDKPEPPVPEPVYKAAVGGRDTAPMALVDTEVSKQLRTALQHIDRSRVACAGRTGNAQQT